MDYDLNRVLLIEVKLENIKSLTIANSIIIKDMKYLLLAWKEEILERERIEKICLKKGVELHE